MDILEEARKDAKMIVTDGGFELPAIFDNQAGTVIQSTALFIRRTDTLNYEDGSSKKEPYSSLTVDYDIFNFTEKYISLKNWTVEVESNVYLIEQSNPNLTLGIIQCDLKDNG